MAVERLVFAPIVPHRHPAGARLGARLERAVAAAAESVGELVAPTHEPDALASLRRWEPRGTLGWHAGRASDNNEVLKQSVLIAGTYSYSGIFSFVVTMSVVAEDDVHRVAYEHRWVAETLAMLSIAGHFFGAVNATLLRVGLMLQNLDDAVSSKASRGRVFTEDQRKIREAAYYAQARASARSLAHDPRETCRELFDPLLVSFMDPGDDVLADIAPR